MFPIFKRTLVTLRNRQHHPSPELISSRKTATLSPLNSLFPLPQPLVTPMLLSVPAKRTTLDTSRKCDRIAFALV